MRTNTLIASFCKVDDFCREFEPAWYQTLLSTAPGKRNRRGRLTLSEIITVLVFFHQSGFKDFKRYYLCFEIKFQHFFPHLISYSRFVEIERQALIPLLAFVHSMKGQCTGISIIDSTPIVVCHNKRIHSHQVFESLAKRGKSSMGWFFGFKLHIVINHLGELLAFKMTPGNTSDLKSVEPLSNGLFGKLFGDKGYISQSLFNKLLAKGLHLVTQIRSNMKNKLMNLTDRMMLRKRSLVESVFHIFKDVLTMEHTRHRSPINFMVNMASGLAAYCLSDSKPKMKFASSLIGQPVLA